MQQTQQNSKNHLHGNLNPFEIRSTIQERTQLTRPTSTDTNDTHINLILDFRETDPFLSFPILTFRRRFRIRRRHLPVVTCFPQESRAHFLNWRQTDNIFHFSARTPRAGSKTRPDRANAYLQYAFALYKLADERGVAQLKAGVAGYLRGFWRLPIRGDAVHAGTVGWEGGECVADGYGWENGGGGAVLGGGAGGAAGEMRVGGRCVEAAVLGLLARLPDKS